MKKNIKDKMALIKETVSLINNPGGLLVSKAKDTNPNVMAIGWGTMGYIWKKPVFIVLVRPSRYTYELINSSGEFSVNIPYPSMKDIVNYCGTHSGRNYDKFKEINIKPIPSIRIKTPIISECAINYECRVIHFNEINQKIIPQKILNEYYPKDDYHRVFFGEILVVQADSPFNESLL